MKVTPRAFSIAVFAILLSGNAFAQNLITDPDFATASTDWVFTNQPASGYTGNLGDTAAYVNCFADQAGDCGPSNSASISQTIPTNIGDQYDVSFWLAENYSGSFYSGGQLSASFGATTGFLATDTSGISPVAWTTETFDVTATASSSTFTLASQSVKGTFFLSDVSVTDLGPTAVPEGSSSLAYLFACLACICIALAKRMKRVS
jgi:hypothetical protein